ncbi:SDR family NAD(P)-dependent oxidoreductase [Streptosporangium lutulentum]|uniref:Short-subunit dehydrogenase involved in D-alanine esterification of teichoic acids n=1 Tax=Streptosporangium lutulentum TaxID=1461250 RepID=A0ABT9QBK5_9ACTN|nr:SDR family NAD(P)-dependent oxidoreductase [Streptosporangium lutulentum]MDP9843770.1 short-subunit dehydrogenase involved in D-alanine esterification of teichoic acids [Streptosporangium lutulentum]
MTTPGKSSVLITGGGSGIGLGLARRYHAAGHRVMITGRSADRLASVADHVPGIETFTNDVGVPQDRRRLADHVRQVMPELDVLINNAGIQRRVGIASDHSDFDEMSTRFAVPVLKGRSYGSVAAVRPPQAPVGLDPAG